MSNRTERDREIKRRRSRRRKVHKLKDRLAQARDLVERQRLTEKLKKITIYPESSSQEN